MAFKYRRPSEDAMEKRATQQGGQFTSFIKDEYRTYSAKKGDNAIRFLPRHEDEKADTYGEDVWVHYGVGPDKGSVVCPYKMMNEPCPLCEERSRAEKRGDQEAAGELKPTRRVVAWIIDRKNEDQGPLVWAMPWTVDRDIAKQARDRETGKYYFLDDPEQGYDVYFDRDGEQRNTKYSGFQLARRASSVEPKFLEFIEKNPLLDVLMMRDYDEIKAIYEGPSVDAAADRPAERRDDDRPREREREPAPRGDDRALERPREVQGEVLSRDDSPFDVADKARDATPPPREPEPAEEAGAPSGAERAAALRARFAKR